MQRQLVRNVMTVSVIGHPIKECLRILGLGNADKCLLTLMLEMPGMPRLYSTSSSSNLRRFMERFELITRGQLIKFI